MKEITLVFGLKRKNMNRKEYKNKINSMYEYGGQDYLTANEVKEVRKEIRSVDGIILKDFNNRAVIKFIENGYLLQSYYTDVCKVVDGKFIKLWNGYSATTLKHINAFRKYLRLNPINKYVWVMLEVE